MGTSKEMTNGRIHARERIRWNVERVSKHILDFLTKAARNRRWIWVIWGRKGDEGEKRKRWNWGAKNKLAKKNQGSSSQA